MKKLSKKITVESLVEDGIGQLKSKKQLLKEGLLSFIPEHEFATFKNVEAKELTLIARDVQCLGKIVRIHFKTFFYKNSVIAYYYENKTGIRRALVLPVEAFKK